MENQIVIKQLPVISHQLKLAGESVRKRIADLELDKQIATEETRGAIKALRAELNKESADLETHVKAVVSDVEKPLLEFKELYKKEIKDPYKEADTILKDQVAIVEDKIKRDKQKNVIEYFTELTQSEKIDFLTFENIGIEINLSISEKKYKEQVNAFVMKVVDDLALIKTTDYEAETLTEYKRTLNVSNAITTVKTRKDKEAEEEAKIKAERIQNRKNALIKLGLNYVEITNSYEYNEEIFVSLSDVNNMSVVDFTAKHAEINAKILDEKAKAKAIEVVETPAETIETPKEVETKKPILVVGKPITSPTVETPEEPIKTASFEVKATMTKLRALGEFMKTNGIIYKNI